MEVSRLNILSEDGLIILLLHHHHHHHHVRGGGGGGGGGEGLETECSEGRYGGRCVDQSHEATFRHPGTTPPYD